VNEPKSGLSSPEAVGSFLRATLELPRAQNTVSLSDVSSEAITVVFEQSTQRRMRLPMRRVRELPPAMRNFFVLTLLANLVPNSLSPQEFAELYMQLVTEMKQVSLFSSPSVSRSRKSNAKPTGEEPDLG
jgi:hypothetical protein